MTVSVSVQEEVTVTVMSVFQSPEGSSARAAGASSNAIVASAEVKRMLAQR